jgi:hypothetical protein
VQDAGRGLISAYYWSAISRFLETPIENIIGRLAMGVLHGQIEAAQRRAWEEEVTLLKNGLSGLDGAHFLEFDVPRLGSRIDAVVVAGPAIFPY